MRIFLLGLMGSGKSSVGKLLARALSCPFYDSDTLIEAKAGKSIARIFSEDGEAAFRTLESEILTELSHAPEGVIACGGGAILSAPNRTLMAKTGIPIVLQASLDSLEKRLEKETGKRPLLPEENWKDRLKEIAAARSPLYAKIPTQIDTDDKTPEAIAAEIRQRVGV
jgi:shikimate kinase